MAGYLPSLSLSYPDVKLEYEFPEVRTGNEERHGKVANSRHGEDTMTRRQGPGNYYQGHSQEDDQRSQQGMKGWGRGSEDPERNHTGKECLFHTVYSIIFLSVFKLKHIWGFFC